MIKLRYAVDSCTGEGRSFHAFKVLDPISLIPCKSRYHGLVCVMHNALTTTQLLKLRGWKRTGVKHSHPEPNRIRRAGKFATPNVTFSIHPTQPTQASHRLYPAKMMTMPMRSAVAQALRASGRGLQAKSLTSRVAGFLIAPSYKSRVAARGYATATAAKKTTTAAAKKPATKKPAAAKKPAAKKTTAKTATKAKKTVKSTKKAVAKPKKPAAKKREVNPERQKLLLRRALKKTALLHQEPKGLPASAWLVFTSQAIKADSSVHGPATLGPKMQGLAVEFRSLSPDDRKVSIANVRATLRDPY